MIVNDSCKLPCVGGRVTRHLHDPVSSSVVWQSIEARTGMGTLSVYHQLAKRIVVV